jgi:hypothetical protein
MRRDAKDRPLQQKDLKARASEGRRYKTTQEGTMYRVPLTIRLCRTFDFAQGKHKCAIP